MKKISIYGILFLSLSIICLIIMTIKGDDELELSFWATLIISQIHFKKL